MKVLPFRVLAKVHSGGMVRYETWSPRKTCRLQTVGRSLQSRSRRTRGLPSQVCGIIEYLFGQLVRQNCRSGTYK